MLLKWTETRSHDLPQIVFKSLFAIILFLDMDFVFLFCEFGQWTQRNIITLENCTTG